MNDLPKLGFPYDYSDKFNYSKRFLVTKTETATDEVDMLYASGIMIYENINWSDFSFTPDFTNQTIVNEVTKLCEEITFFPQSQTLLLSDQSMCHLVENSNQFLTGVAGTLQVSDKEAYHYIKAFFDDKTLLVQPTGLQGALYKVGTTLQTAGPAAMTFHAVTMARVTAVTTGQILLSQPFLVIAVPTVGAIFFSGLGVMTGNGTNIVSRTCFSISHGFSIPMYGCELMYNAYVGPVIGKVAGVPTVLNMTAQLRNGPGIAPAIASKILKDANNSILKSFKGWLIEQIKRLPGPKPS